MLDDLLEALMLIFCKKVITNKISLDDIIKNLSEDSTA